MGWHNSNNYFKHKIILSTKLANQILANKKEATYKIIHSMEQKKDKRISPNTENAMIWSQFMMIIIIIMSSTPTYL